MNKILLAGASFGWGHIQAANNIEKAILESDATSEVRKIDVLDFFPPGLGVICKASWRSMSANVRYAYSLFYDKSVNQRWSGSTMALLARYAVDRMAFKLTNAPDVFIATHSFAVPIGSLMKKRFGCKLCVVATDFVLHQMQFVPNVDCFFVPPSYECKKPLGRADDIETTLLDTGIPISSDFGATKDVMALKAKFGLSPHLATVLVSFGGSGLRAELHTKLFSELLDGDLPLQFIVLTGHNSQFARSLRQRCGTSKHRERIKVYDFVKDVSDFYAVADLFIGKAGGLSISEALAVGLPLTIIDFLPGQEEANLRVMTANGLGTYVTGARALKKHVEDLLPTVSKQGETRKVQEFGRPFSSRAIATRVAEMTA